MSLTLTRRHNVDRFGYLVPTKYGNVPMVGAVATYRPGEGRFGGAVAVEEGTTNLLGTLSPKGNAKVTTEITHYTNEPVFYCDGSADYQGIRASQRVTLTAGTEYTFSVYVYNPSTGEGALNIQVDSDEVQNEGIGTVVVPPGPGWHRIVRKWSPPANRNVSTIRFENRPRASWQSGSNQCYMTAPQVEAKPFATSFVDGTRAGGRLSYPKSLIAGLNALTVAAWTSGPSYWGSENKYLVAAQTSGTSPYGDLFALRQTMTNNNISLWVQNGVNSAVADVAYDNVWDGNWHLIVGVINKSPEPGRQPIELYVEGELVASHSNVNAVPDLSNINETWGVQVGNWRGGLQWDGLIDELLILPYAASEEEIRTWYEADGPLPPHPDALLQWDWQAVRPATMVAL